MDADQISNIEKLLPLAEKYGLAVLLVFVLLIVVLVQWRAVMTGKLVPRDMLDRALEDNDRLQDILDKERAAFMQPTLEVLQRLKIDHAAGGGHDEERGG